MKPHELHNQRIKTSIGKISEHARTVRSVLQFIADYNDEETTLPLFSCALIDQLLLECLNVKSASDKLAELADPSGISELPF